MFPLGNYLKKDVKKIAQEAGLDMIVRKKESMGMCFIGKREYQNFISEYIDDKPGKFIDLDTGIVVGEHKGIHYWTIGQRCKIAGWNPPYFVFRKDIESNNILVVSGTNHPALYTDFVVTEAPHWIAAEPSDFSQNWNILDCDFRFQHRNSLIPCRVCKTVDNKLVIQLSQPFRAITSGQYAVLYSGEECLGSAPISHPGPSYYSLNEPLSIEHLYNGQYVKKSICATA